MPQFPRRQGSNQRDSSRRFGRVWVLEDKKPALVMFKPGPSDGRNTQVLPADEARDASRSPARANDETIKQALARKLGRHGLHRRSEKSSHTARRRRCLGSARRCRRTTARAKARCALARHRPRDPRRQFLPDGTERLGKSTCMNVRLSRHADRRYVPVF
jgi:hypothetical protein